MLYLIGGGQPPWSKEFSTHFYNTTKDMKRMLLIPTEVDDVGRNNFYLKAYSEYFSSIGLKLENVHLVNKEETFSDIKKQIDKSDIVFLMGGRPIAQLEWCKNMDITEALQNYKGVIMGTSAGALTLSKKAIITKHKGYPNTLVFDGLDIANGISVEVHYDEKNDEQVTELRKLIENSFDCIYTLSEGCALAIDNDNIFYLGSSPLVIYLKKDTSVRNLILQTDNVKYSII